jgi:hypothetical protein
MKYSQLVWVTWLIEKWRLFDSEESLADFGLKLSLSSQESKVLEFQGRWSSCIMSEAG